jgi:hypothetical protein
VWEKNEFLRLGRVRKEGYENMALGGGNFIAQNKVLPGAYINFVSLARMGAALSQRGSAAFALELDWGAEDEVFIVTNDEFIKNSMSIFGYDYSHEKMTGLRELFRNAQTLYAYRLGGLGADHAGCEFGAARYGGLRGNDLCVVITQNAGSFTVRTLIDGENGSKTEVDSQTVTNAAQLLDNDFVVWDDEAVLAATAGTPFTGGQNADVNFSSYQRFLSQIQSYYVNAAGVCSDDPKVNALFADFAKNIRDTAGIKLQCVVFDYPGDHEGVVNVKNCAELVYWVTGIIAGCAVNKSNLNKAYDGEYDIRADYSQSQLEDAIKAGQFTLHKVGDSLRVLADINSLTTICDEKGEAFKDNQTIRVIDQIAGDIAALFNNKYLGNVANDESGRVSLWADIVKHHEELARIRAIEDFSDEDVEVLPGDDKRSVVVRGRINVVNAMAQVYMTCVIS